ncbi:hypothetical protein MBLNU459_g1151t1 [Dothideomycetes sp. NU459]
MAQTATSPTALPSSAVPNGVVSPSTTRGVVGGNRKKQKRRAKQAARQQQDLPSPPLPADPVHAHRLHTHQHQHDHEDDLASDALDAFDHDGEYYDSEEDDRYGSAASPPADPYQGFPRDQIPDLGPDATSSAKRKNRKKRRSTSAQQHLPYSGHVPDEISFIDRLPPPPMSSAVYRSVQRSAKQDRIWNTSTQEERERIKEFWLSLSEEDRKSLLKIEKEAVLRKMKEQQKHSCSCTVCGRKRTAIEEELEVLYDAYYKELEQYANHQTGEFGEGMLPPSRVLTSGTLHRDPAIPLPLSTAHPTHRTSRVHEIIDDEEQELSEDEEEYSEDEDDLYSDEEDEPEDDMARHGIGADFFNFGNSLTVKGGILTVADDLLKNDGKKFIEMMEQLAERRMQREQEAEYAASQPTHSYAPNGHEPPLEDEDYDEEEEDYDSQEDYDDDEEESEMGGMTEEQRMEEGRRMFQIFAARMFEQRVLTAYREKVAAERQQKLLEELEDESRLDAEKEAKKARDAEKRKNKKNAQKQAKAEEKAKREAEKAAEEAAAKAVEEKKLEEQRRRKEEQRKKKELERKAQEEEKQRKEAERLKRQQEDRERRLEAERKLQEVKALEKKQRDEARKKEREEREAREKEAREKKAQEDRDRKEKEAKAKAERNAHHHPHHPPQIAKRPSQAGMVAVPGFHPKQSSSGFPSPHVPVATPVLAKAPTPAHPARQNSYHGSHGSSPKTSHTSTGPSKSTSPSSTLSQQPSVAPKTILQKPQNQLPVMHHPQPHSPINQLPPIGVHSQQPHHNTGFGGFPQMGGFPGYHVPQGAFMGQRQPLPGFPHQPPIGSQFQPFHPTNGMPGPPPGMNGLGMMGQVRGFQMDNGPGFQQHQAPSVGPQNAAPGFGGMTRNTMPSHSRAHSHDKPNVVESTAPVSQALPIQRPAPIQRPSSVKPREGAEVDDLSRHLGSSALLDDADDPLPAAPERRASTIGGPRASGPMNFSSPMQFNQPRMESFGNPNSSWSSPGMAFGPPGLSAASSSWGAAPGMNAGLFQHNGFGSLGGHRSSVANRPLTIRLAVCQACKQLAAREPTADGYHAVDALVHVIEAGRPPLDAPITLQEIEEICETEGDAQNGGGLLNVRHDGSTPGGFSVKFEPDAATPAAGGRSGPADQGVIGSPMPGHSMPAFGAIANSSQRTFGSLGGVMASPGFS